jgi:hypothetical protein
MVDFKALLKQRVADVKRPPPMPTGTYKAVVTDIKPGQSRQKKTPLLSFSYRVVEPMADVDAEALALVPKWHGKEMTQDWYLTEDALYRLGEHITKHLGIDIGERTYDEVLPECKMKEVYIHVVQNPSAKPGSDEVYNNISEFSKV